MQRKTDHTKYKPIYQFCKEKELASFKKSLKCSLIHLSLSVLLLQSFGLNSGWQKLV